MTMPTIGEIAPDFTLSDQEGNIHKLSDYRGTNVILYFYPRDNTSGCTREACTFRDLFSVVRHANAVVLGVSPDSVKSHIEFAEKNQLPFPLLVDLKGIAARAYGVWVEKKSAGEKKLGVQRSTFLIGPEGRIIKAWPRVDVEGHATEVIAALTGKTPARRAAEKVEAGREKKKRPTSKKVALRRSANKSEVAKRAVKRQFGEAKGRVTQLASKRGNIKPSVSRKAQPKSSSGKAKVLSRATKGLS